MNVNQDELSAELNRLAILLNQTRPYPIVIGCAESCTGGMLASTLTNMAGASAWFYQGFVTYSNQAKILALGVSPQTLNTVGAVSQSVAEQMAKGVLDHNPDINLAISTTGIAGPTGGTPAKPIGTVWFGLAYRAGTCLGGHSEMKLFRGDRLSIRTQATQHALAMLSTYLSSSP